MGYKTGEVLYCEDCGFEVTVTKGCDCEDRCVIKCCGKPMKVKGEPKTKPGGRCCCN